MKNIAERIAHLTPEQRALLALRRKKMAKAETGKRVIPKKQGEGPWPASIDQEALWFWHQLNPDSPAYNIPSLTRLKGKVDYDLMTQSLNLLIQRQEILRTTLYVLDGKPYQKVLSELKLEVPVIGVDHLPEEEREAAASRELTRLVNIPFDFENGPLLRLNLIRLGPEDHIIIAVLLHAITDWWSFQTFFSELFTFYRALLEKRPPVLPEMPIQFTDYAVWRNQWFRSEAYRKQRDYWVNKLQGAPTILEIPGDRPRPPHPDYHGAREFFTVPPKLVEALRAVNRKGNASTLMTTLAVTMVFLSRYTGALDILTGITVTNRDEEEVRRMIGYLLNILIIRGQLFGNPSLLGLLEQIRGNVLEAMENRELPFRSLVEALNPERDSSRMPIYQVEFIYVSWGGASHGMMPWESGEDAPFDSEHFHIDRQISPVDLQISFLEMEDGMELWFEYQTQLFDAGTVRRMGELLLGLMSHLLDRPEQPVFEVAWLPKEERETLLHQWNATDRDFKGETLIHRLFQQQAEAKPEHPAVEASGKKLSYAELQQRVTDLAVLLRGMGVGPETSVGICLHRSERMVVAVLAVLQAGGAYLPLDPSHPEERLQYIVRDADPALVVTESEAAHVLGDCAVPTLVLDRTEIPDSKEAFAEPDSDQSYRLAYLIYTSGSTGRPKGVGVPHRTVANLFHAMANEPGMTGEDRLLAVTTLSFDISVAELWFPLAWGATVILADKETAGDGRLLAELMNRSKPTVMQATPATWRMLLASGWKGDAKLQIQVGGEAFPADLAAELLACCGSVWNLYGPTEATVWSTRTRVAEGDEIHIGKPIENTKVYVLDRFARPVPVGVAGELMLGGMGLARGYHGRPDLTAERFLPDPFSGAADARMYRTGDLVRLRPDGCIKFLGRLDFQVKIRGFRIELGEIETVLGKHPAVDEAVVLAGTAASGDARLVAYATRKDALDAEVLRAYLEERLPGYMVPAFFVFLEEMPRNASGKLNRRALPEPEVLDAKQEYVPPRNSLERDIADIWREVLGAERVGVLDSFFAMGGHSLLATQVLSRIRQRFNVEVPLKDFFGQPTVAALASLAEHSQRAIELPPLERVSRNQPLALSYSQERMWFLNRLDPDSPVYNMPIPVSLEGELDKAVLVRAIQEIVDRHESLRTHFRLREDQPEQVIADTMAVELEEVSFEEVAEAERESAATARVARDALKSFDLERGPLIRFTLYGIHDRLHFLLVGMHHIISDGWSLVVFFKELASLYKAYIEGGESPLAPLSRQYVDFAHWQRSWLCGPVLERALDYWRKCLAGAPQHIELPTDRQRPAVQGYEGRMLDFYLPETVTGRVDALAAREGLTAFMILLGAFGELLARYSRQRDLCIGTPIANRNRADTEGMIGLFVNSLVLRLDLGRDPSFASLMHRVRKTALEAYDNQDVSFEQVVDAVQPERDMSRTPLFQVLFSYENIGINDRMEVPLPGLVLRPLAYEFRVAKFDVSLHMAKQEGRLGGVLEYNSDLFETETMECMRDCFCRLLEGLLTRPGEPMSTVDMLSSEKRTLVLETWNQTTADYPRNACIHRLFEAQAAKNPGEPALLFENRKMSYEALNHAANRLAQTLKSHGIGPESRVGLCMDTSFSMIAAVLAILKCGGAYVPISTEYPEERIRWMAEDAGLSLMIAGPEFEWPENDGLPLLRLGAEPEDGPSAANLEGFESADLCAYVMYTSGSTGKPKGVAVTHRNVVRLVSGNDYVAFGPEETLLQASSISFDAATFEIWGALLNGARLALMPFGATDRLAEILPLHGVTTLWLTAQLFNLMVDDHIEALAGVRQVLAGGEALSVPHVRKFRERYPEHRLVNGYGPTEATTFTCCADLRRVEPTPFGVPIGGPIKNTTVYILDDGLRPVPVGVFGHLFIGGDGLSRGYHDRPGQTAWAFIPNPHSGIDSDRLYRSGDLARYLADGNIEFGGRVDRQIKLRGFRIELGEIEYQLGQIPGIKDVLVRLVTEDDVPARLVAYLVANESADLDAIPAQLAERLPGYAIPSAMVVLDAIPTTPNGKVDVKALPLPGHEPGEERSFVAPKTPTEELVQEVWQGLLNLDRVSMKDNFFELGGHSLLATRAATRLSQKLEIHVPLQAMFQYVVAADLARYLDVTRMSLAAATEAATEDEEEGVI